MDIFDAAKRSAIMSKVASKNTSPELAVRAALFRAGYRFRLHDKSLPGSPDIVMRKHKTVVFVHGCFWHGHSCPRGKLPSSNLPKWEKKIARNIERDVEAKSRLLALGWRVETVWTCSLKANTQAIISRLKASSS